MNRIRKSLDKIIGKEKMFTQADKKAIYSKIQKEGGHQMKLRRKNKWAIALSYGLSAVVLFVLVWAGIHKNQPEENASSKYETSTVQNTSNVKEDQLPHQSLTQGASSPLHQLLNEKPKLSTEGAELYPKKFQIVKTMYYSWEHIHNIQGQIEAGYPQMKLKGETTFYLDLDQQRNWANLVRTKNGKPDLFENVLYKDHKIILERPKQKVFTEMSFDNKQKINFNVYESLNFGNGNVMNSLWFRELTNNYNNWSYKEGTKLGMSVYEIEGTTERGEPFTMTIAMNTGIVLDYKQYDKNNPNILEEYLTVKQVKINKGIPASQFQLNVSGDKKQPFVDYNSNIGGGALIDRGKICGANCR